MKGAYLQKLGPKETGKAPAASSHEALNFSLAYDKHHPRHYLK